MTGMPRFVAAATFTLTGPPRATPMNFSLGSRSRMCSFTGARSVTRASASAATSMTGSNGPTYSWISSSLLRAVPGQSSRPVLMSHGGMIASISCWKISGLMKPLPSIAIFTYVLFLLVRAAYFFWPRFPNCLMASPICAGDKISGLPKSRLSSASCAIDSTLSAPL